MRFGSFVRMIVFASTVVAFACGGAESPAPPESAVGSEVEAAALERAREAADQLMGTLKARLSEEMGEGGPVAAVKVCAQVAPDIAAHASVDGLIVRRVSRRTRNPDNAPDDWERAKLVALEDDLDDDGEIPDDLHEVVELAGDSKELRYLRPIRAGSVCLTCHGSEDAMPSELRAAIEERYPNDRATGYESGDLRGAVSVRVALDVEEGPPVY